MEAFESSDAIVSEYTYLGPKLRNAQRETDSDVLCLRCGPPTRAIRYRRGYKPRHIMVPYS